MTARVRRYKIQGMEIPQQWTSRYDHGERRKSTRKQREKGVAIYVPAAELAAAGIDPDGPPPDYKLWATSKGGVMLRFYVPLDSDRERV